MKNKVKKEIKHEKLLHRINSLKIESVPKQGAKTNPKKGQGIRKFGFGKGTFTYISEDFDDPLEEFKDYMP